MNNEEQTKANSVSLTHIQERCHAVCACGQIKANTNLPFRSRLRDNNGHIIYEICCHGIEIINNKPENNITSIVHEQYLKRSEVEKNFPLLKI